MRPGDIDEDRDVAVPSRTHFGDHDVVRLIRCAKQQFTHADLVVFVARRREHAISVLRGAELREKGFGGRLARASGNGDDEPVEELAGDASERHVCTVRPLDQHRGDTSDSRRGPVEHEQRRAAPHRFGGEIVSVETRAVQGHKCFARLDASRISGDAQRGRCASAVHEHRARRGDRTVERHSHRGVPSSDSASRATAASSNGRIRSPTI